MWFDIWFSAIPFPIEHVYKIPFYAGLYPFFGSIHYYEGWGHLGNTPSPCEPSYAYSVAQGQNWVYSALNYADDLTYLKIMGMVCVLCPLFGFITYYLKKCTEDD
jgi:hypothetical protein